MIPRPGLVWLMVATVALSAIGCSGDDDDVSALRTQVSGFQTQLAEPTSAVAPTTAMPTVTPPPSAEERFCERLSEWRDAAQQTELVANVIARAEVQGREELRAAFHAASNVVVPSGQTAAQTELASDVLEWARLYEAWLIGLTQMYSATTVADFERLAAESNQMILAINDHERGMAPKLESACRIPPIDPYKKPSASR